MKRLLILISLTLLGLGLWLGLAYDKGPTSTAFEVQKGLDSKSDLRAEELAKAPLPTRDSTPRRDPHQVPEPEVWAAPVSPKPNVLGTLRGPVQDVPWLLLNFERGSKSVSARITEDGRWEARLPQGSWSVSAVGTPCGSLPISPDQIEVSSETTTATLTLLQVPSLTWRIVDCEGRPVPNLPVQISSMGRSPKALNTNLLGEVTLKCPDEWSYHSLAVRSADLPDDLLPPWWQTLGRRAPQPTWTEPLEVVLSRKGLLFGEALHENGTPISDANLSFRQCEGPGKPLTGLNFVVRTNGFGRYEIPNLDVGWYEVWAFHRTPENPLRPRPLSVEIHCGMGDRSHDLVFPAWTGTGRIQIRAKTVESTPVSGLEFQVCLVPLGTERAAQDPRQYLGSIVSSDQGTGELSGLPWGTYRVTRYGDGPADTNLGFRNEGPHHHEFVLSPERPSTKLDWPLGARALARIVGRVTGDYAQTLRAIVQVNTSYPRSGKTHQVVLFEPDETFEFLGLAQGSATVRITIPGGRDLAKKLVGTRAGEIVEIEFDATEFR